MDIKTNPYPYIFAAYLLGLFLIFGYATWLKTEGKKLKKYIEASKTDEH